MGAGTQYPANLNMDAIGIQTPAVYDAVLDEWLMISKTMVANSTGILVPLTLDSNNRLQASVKDSVLPTGAATSGNQTTIIGHVDGVEAALNAIQGYIDGIEGVLGTAVASPTINTIAARLKDLATLIGEAGASPTANTVLARIKALENYLDGVETALGVTSDATATGDGSLIAITKQLRKLITDTYSTFGSSAPTKGMMISGSDGTNARAIKTTEAGEVVTQVSGSNVEIGGKNFPLSDVDTIRGKSADRPTAANAHAAIPYCFYYSIDTDVVTVTDGTNWKVI